MLRFFDFRAMEFRVPLPFFFRFFFSYLQGGSNGKRERKEGKGERFSPAHVNQAVDGISIHFERQQRCSFSECVFDKLLLAELIDKR